MTKEDLMRAHKAGCAAARAAVPEVLIPAGAAAITYGVSLIDIPAGWIVGGILTLTCGVLDARTREPRTEGQS